MASDNKGGCALLIVCVVFTILGSGLCFSGLWVPKWYIVKVGIITHNLGIWLDRVCIGEDNCENHIFEREGYVRAVDWPEDGIIRWFETVGVILSGIAICGSVCVWMCRNGSTTQKTVVQIIYFPSIMVAGFLSVVGTLILSSKGDEDKASWAPFLSGIGGALLFIAGSMSCLSFRNDPNYGTLDNQ